MGKEGVTSPLGMSAWVAMVDPNPLLPLLFFRHCSRISTTLLTGAEKNQEAEENFIRLV